MNILEVASEAAPFIKSGGLGDVIGALPKELSRRGHSVVTVIPRYASIPVQGLHRSDLEGEVHVAGATHRFTRYTVQCRKTRHVTWLVDNPSMFGRKGLYQDSETGKDFIDNDIRYQLFAKAALECCRRNQFQPDIVHYHDWQGALAGVYLKTLYQDDPFFAHTKTVLTIHNLAYQGKFSPERFRLLGLSDDLFVPTAPCEFYGSVNMLKAGISFADWITTVSPRYAAEIQTAEFGCGLEGVLHERRHVLTGILNGVDYGEWSPSRDSKIPFRYHAANRAGKKKNKIELLARAGLPFREKSPLIGMISRLVDQKGLDTIAAAAEELMKRDIQFIVLGVGERRYHQFLSELQESYPDKVRVYLTFDDALAHLIEAGSDMYLMPSRFEPCGLNQLYSLKYGTIPIVTRVGGLADSVVDIAAGDEQGTGFVMTDASSKALLEAVDRAIACFTKTRQWSTLVKTAMKQNFSWEHSAAMYEQLFQTLMRKDA